MRKLYIILLLLFLSCSKDTILDNDTVPCKKDCYLNLVQVTVNGIHLVKSSELKTIDCDTDTEPFDIIRNSDGRIIQYKIYRCN